MLEGTQVPVILDMFICVGGMEASGTTHEGQTDIRRPTQLPYQAHVFVH